MKKICTYRSPVISYEVFKEDSFYHINTYIENAESSADPALHVLIKNFSRDFETADLFAKIISSAAALPVHVEELADSFLSR